MADAPGLSPLPPGRKVGRKAAPARNRGPVEARTERERAADASGSGRGPPGLLGGLFARLTGQDPAGGATSSSSEEDEPPAKRM